MNEGMLFRKCSYGFVLHKDVSEFGCGSRAVLDSSSDLSLPSSEPITKLWVFAFSLSFLSYKPGLGSEVRT